MDHRTSPRGGDDTNKAADTAPAGVEKQADSEHPKSDHPAGEHEHPAGDHPDSAKASGEHPKADHPK